MHMVNHGNELEEEKMFEFLMRCEHREQYT